VDRFVLTGSQRAETYAHFFLQGKTLMLTQP